VTQRVSEDWNVEESTVVNEWIAKGEKRGIAIGEIRQTQQLIVRLGVKRFGPPLTDIEATVQAIQDRARLEQIADRIDEASDWADLVATP
jgi:hypothetical protein